MEITGNGTFKLPSNTYWPSTSVYVGDSKGASVVLVHKSSLLEDGSLSGNTQYVIHHGRGAVIEVVVTGFVDDFTIDVYKGV